MIKGLLRFLSGAILFVGLILVFGSKCGSDDRKQVSKEEPAAFSVVPEPPTLQEELAAVRQLHEAIDILKPHMTNQNLENDTASALLAIWSSKHLTWQALERLTDNKHAEVMKDHVPFLGSKVCTRGTIAEIFTDRSTGETLYSGGIVTNSFSISRFIAVGSTDAITQDSNARLCGIVTGLTSYENAGGGTSSGVKLVGMFDIPQNHGR